MDNPGSSTDNQQIESIHYFMKFFFDLLPVILFFGTFKLAEGNPAGTLEFLSSLGVQDVPPAQSAILLATVVVMLATAGQIGWTWFRHGKVDRLLWISLALVVSLGGLTLFFRNENFIKWKPTALYLVMGCGLLIADWAGKSPLKALLGEKITLPPLIWKKLAWMWAVFFGFLAGLNLFVAYQFSTDTWVNFKLFGLTGLLFVFIVGQGLYLTPYLQAEASEEEKT